MDSSEEETPAQADDLYCWVDREEMARGRQWQGVGPLTLSLLTERLQRQHPHLPLLTADNARQLCSLVEELVLQLCALGSTDLLWLFRNLRRLDLSNNFLKQVQSISDLTCLTSLNLSYNKLTNMDGLNQLSQLEVLSLQGNKIEAITEDHLCGLTNLQLLNLTDNLLAEKNDIIALRSLSSLRSGSLRGNPVCEGAMQASLVVALLPKLVHLDGCPLLPARKHAAAIQFKELLEATECTEKFAEDKVREEKLLLEDESQHLAAGVLALDDGSLFKTMFADDIEAKILLKLPGADRLVDRYKKQVNGVCSTVFESGMQHELERQHELRLLRSCLQTAYESADNIAKRRVNELQEELATVLADLTALGDEKLPSTGDEQELQQARVRRAEDLEDTAEQVMEDAAYRLLGEEVVMGDKVMDVISRADAELGRLVGDFLHGAGVQFKEARAMAYTFYCRLRDITNKFSASPNIMALFSSPFESTDTTEDDSLIGKASFQDSAATVFDGEDTLALALAGIHERHLKTITAREVQLQRHLQHWLTNTVQHLQQAEWQRHRSRLQEINAMLDAHRDKTQFAARAVLGEY